MKPNHKLKNEIFMRIENFGDGEEEKAKIVSCTRV